MHIILDASTIIDENFGRSARFRTLLLASFALGYKVCVPRLAVAETVAKFSRDFSRDFNLVRRDLGKMAKLLDRPLDEGVLGLVPEEEKEAFETALFAGLNCAGAKLLDYPDITHEEVARKAISRKRPFNEKGSGYRDALIWSSTLELARETEDALILVSADGDFGDHEGLHKDLIDDLVNEGHKEGKITLSKSLSTVIDEQVRPNLTAVLSANPLQTLADLNVDTQEFMLLAIYGAYNNVEWEPDQLGLPAECQTPTLYYVEGAENLNVMNVRELPDDKLLVIVEADVDGGFNFYMLYADWDALEDDPRLLAWDLDWNDHGLLGEVTLQLHAKVDVLVDVLDPLEPQAQVISMVPRDP